MKLKPYLGSAAIAAMVMAGVPALAQTSPGSAPSSGAPAATAPSGPATSETPSSAQQQQHQRKRSTARRQQHKKPSQAQSGSSGPDAQQLNSQELQRLQQTNR